MSPKQKAMKFLLNNEAPEWAKYISVNLLYPRITFCSHVEADNAIEWVVFPIAELTDSESITFDKLQEEFPTLAQDATVFSDDLEKLCTKYGAYLWSDDFDGKDAVKNMTMVVNIADAAMRLHFTGYDELIKCLEGESK